MVSPSFSGVEKALTHMNRIAKNHDAAKRAD
jgi:hypothetical protein